LLTIILISFPSSPEFHRIVPLLQTCSIFKCVYDIFNIYTYIYNMCLFLYIIYTICVYLLDLSSTYERKHVAFAFSFFFFQSSSVFIVLTYLFHRCSPGVLSPLFSQMLRKESCDYSLDSMWQDSLEVDNLKWDLEDDSKMAMQVEMST
jgi:hypothetical protein